MTKDLELVRVFATGDLARYLFAKSLLDRDEIEYVAKNETRAAWSPSGEFSLVPAELWVRSEDAERARTLFREIDASA